MTQDIQKPIIFNETDFSNPDILNTKPYRERRCPVMITIDSGHVTAVDIQHLLEAGMNIVKMRISAYSREERVSILKKINEAAEKCSIKYGFQNWPVATCVALKNLVVKTGLLENEENLLHIEDDSEIILTNNLAEYDKCNDKKIFVNNPMLTEEIKTGTEISINSDEIIAKCIEIVDEESVKCVVIKGGMLRNLSEFCARDFKHSRPFMSQKDFQILDFVLDYEIDILIMNYVQDSDSVKDVKKHFENKKHRPILLSGIATLKGLTNIDEILQISDGIVLSRQYLPYELSVAYKYRLPNIQKWLAAKCYQAGKPLFVSGGVFEEAISYGTLEDSQLADVKNAILDGVTGFIFIKCAPSSKLSVQVLTLLNEVCSIVEPLTVSKSHFIRMIAEIEMPVNAAEAAVLSCALAARQTQARIIVIPTVSGRTVKALHWMKPSCTIITVSSKMRISRLLYTYRGVTPLLYDGPQHSSWKATVEGHMSYALEYAVKRGMVQYGDTYVSLQRSTEYSCFCDMVSINKITLRHKPRIECPDTTKKKKGTSSFKH